MALLEKCPRCGKYGEIDPDQAPPNASTSIICTYCEYHYKWEDGVAVSK